MLPASNVPNRFRPADGVKGSRPRIGGGGGFHSAEDPTGSELGEDELTGVNLIGGADQGRAVLMEGEAEAAAEDAQRAEGFEAGGQPGQPVVALEQGMAEGELAAF